MWGKYAEIWYGTAQNEQPHLVPEWSGHIDGVIVLAIRRSR